MSTVAKTPRAWTAFRLPLVVAFSCAAALWGAAHAEIPLVSPTDVRVRYVPYRADAAVTLKVRRGVVTRVVLDKEEKILVTGAGFPSNCEAPTDEWCIRAQKDEYQLWIKPRANATHNNLEIQTDKRDYSLKLEVLADAEHGNAPPEEMFRVMFVYAARPAAAVNADMQPSDQRSPPQVARLQPISTSPHMVQLGCPKARAIANTRYSREAGNGMIEPLRIFDDGAHTVFVFGDAALIPSVFAIDNNGTETRVNFTMDGNCLAVHQLSPQFVLRAGDDAVKVFNEAYSARAPSPQLQRIRANRPDVVP